MKKILYLLIFSSALFSQEILDEVIVSDTRTKKNIKKTGRNVIKINQKEIELKKEYSIAQILNQYAGIYISGAQLHPGQNLTYSIRGGNNRQVQIRIDDVVVFDPSLIESEFDLRMLSLENIESIEIIKGASSSLYGSGASTAVINLKTKDKKDDKLSLNFNSQWGTQNIQNEKINSFGEVDKQSIYIGSKLKN
ncbi:MAG: TonB-dependent receptor, partial [Flavobacteriales bacterium]|nr:TonB-dependent receptor [Flavobacteriales bacterium]